MSMTGAGVSEAREKRGDIQGLRAIAVLSVVVYHASQRFAPGGFLGVDIFFVISGFLITDILLRELERGEMSIAGFYQRRIARLFPALFVVLVAVLAAGAALLSPADYKELAHTAFSTVFFVSNFDFYNLSGYFDGDAATKPLLHTWSLAVEEQFYILFPLLLAVIWALARKRLGLILALLGCVSLAASAWAAYRYPPAAFYLAPFRAFELLLGALTALSPPSARMPQLRRDALSCVGGILIVCSIAFYTLGTPFPGFAALAPCVGAALVLYAGTGGRSLGGRVLSLPMLTFFGAISYSLYLWHWPMLAFGRHYFLGPLTPPQKVLLLSGAILAATLSWKLIEQPLLKRRLSLRRTFALGGAALICTSALAGAVYLSDGAPSRFPPRALTLFASAGDYNRLRSECHNNEDLSIAYTDNCVFGAPGAAPVAAVWGDSAGTEPVVALGEAMAHRGQGVMEITSSACAPALDYQLPIRPACAAHNRDTLEHLIGDDRIRTVILATNFSRYPPSDWPRLFSGLTRSVEGLSAAGKAVVLIYPFPNLWIRPPTLLGIVASRGEDLRTLGVSRASYARDNQQPIAFLDALSRETGAIAFVPVEALCDRVFCPAYRPDLGVLYFNENHVSVTGARLAITRFPFGALPPPES